MSKKVKYTIYLSEYTHKKLITYIDSISKNSHYGLKSMIIEEAILDFLFRHTRTQEQNLTSRLADKEISLPKNMSSQTKNKIYDFINSVKSLGIKKGEKRTKRDIYGILTREIGITDKRTHEKYLKLFLKYGILEEHPKLPNIYIFKVGLEQGEAPINDED